MTATRAARVDRLEHDLRRRVTGEIRFSAGDRAIYSTDASNYRQLPIGVVIPRAVDDVVAAVEVCRDHRVPVLPRGGGTSLAGQSCNTAVVIDFSKYMNRVLEIDPDRGEARVEPGAILDDLRARAEEFGLTFGPDPATHDRCTIGGMVGNDSCGVHSMLSEFYGPGPRTADNVERLTVLTYDGALFDVGRTDHGTLAGITAEGGRRSAIYRAMDQLRGSYDDEIRERYPNMPRRVSGFSLDALLPERGFDVAAALVGSEGTCATVLEATLRLVESPPRRMMILAGFEDVYAAAAAVPVVRELQPIGLEGFDDVLVADNERRGMHAAELARLPAGRGWLLIEVGGRTQDEAEERASSARGTVAHADGFIETRTFSDPQTEKRMWELRESGLGVTAFVPGRPDTYEGWEDSAVPPDQLAGYLRDLRSLLERFRYGGPFYGHFGQGCVHTRTDFDLRSAEGIGRFRSFLDEAADIVVSHGGSLSGEHGDGQSRGELLPKMFGEELVGAFRAFKAAWDPDGMMNPGKVVDPHPITGDLRLGPGYAPPRVATAFPFEREEGGFAHATVRCVGIGLCRRTQEGVMCPSFMVTREEKDTTRGRARILFEMMRGSEIELWRSHEVREALDLCLSCKGCKSDCPVGVDMATLKAEFLSHHFRGRLRPRAAYALGPIFVWARWASKAPGLANAVSHAPALSAFLKWSAGLAAEREAPRFTEATFRSWFADRIDGARAGDPVVLWPDTFTERFHPGVGRAAVHVLEEAGARVTVPPERTACCGRPLYDFGMLDLARRKLRQAVEILSPYVADDVPVIVLEPSCAAVFRDELPELLSGDRDAKRISQRTRTLAEYLDERGWEAPRIGGKALVQVHCHQHAVLGFDADRRMLDRLGIDDEILDSGCCGLAGSFGFERGDKYEVSVAAGERVLAPAIREASRRTMILADGFSCRTQIEHLTGRRAMHLAEVLSEALAGADR